MVKVYIFRENLKESSEFDSFKDLCKAHSFECAEVIFSFKEELDDFEIDRKILIDFLNNGVALALVLKEIPENPAVFIANLANFRRADQIDLLQFDPVRRRVFLDRNRVKFLVENQSVFLVRLLSLKFFDFLDKSANRFRLNQSNFVQRFKNRRIRVLNRSQAAIDFGRQFSRRSKFTSGQTEPGCKQYLISRTCAETLVEFDLENLLSSDMVFLGVSRAGNFRTGRLI